MWNLLHIAEFNSNDFRGKAVVLPVSIRVGWQTGWQAGWLKLGLVNAQLRVSSDFQVVFSLAVYC